MTNEEIEAIKQQTWQQIGFFIPQQKCPKCNEATNFIKVSQVEGKQTRYRCMGCLELYSVDIVVKQILDTKRS